MRTRSCLSGSSLSLVRRPIGLPRLYREVTGILGRFWVTSEATDEHFIEAGFEAIMVSANADIFGEEWLGRKIDHGFRDDLKALSRGRGLDVDVCGENGEFHTVVVDGPLFRKRIEVVYGARVHRNGYWLLDIPRCRLKPK